MTDPSARDPTESLHGSSDPKGIARRFRESLSVELPARIGPYKVLELLGEGGMGVVYLAEQEKPIHRRVALKVIKLGMDTKQVVARFETEREALALMNHPNVAKVYDAGATEEGRPYFAMEHAPGIPITEYCDKHRVSIEERLRLFMDVCHAVQHAHQKGIIHRDIKPSNILVTVQEGEPVPKIIDFGVAKATQHRLTQRTFFTAQGQLIGTPGYMSPEQAEMTALDVDTRTDIYSLGVVLYELLVGARPFDDALLREAALGEIQRIIREVDPPKPSTKLSALQSAPQYEPEAQATGHEAQHEPQYEAQYEPGARATGHEAQHEPQHEPGAQATGHPPLPRGRGSSGRRRADDGRSSVQEIARRRRMEPRTLIRRLRGDLDWIVMKCLEKDRTRRYETANSLALELQRYLDQEPVLAGPPGTTYRMKKFVRRHRQGVIAAGLVVAALIAGIAGTTWQAVRAARERDRAVRAEQWQSRERERAEAARDEAEAVTTFLTDTLAAVDPEKQGKDVTVREVLDKAADQIREKFADQPLIEARLRYTIGWTYFGLGLYDKAEAHLTEGAALYRREKGHRDPDALWALDALAAVLGARGDYRAATAQHKAVLEIQRRVLGEEHPDTLASMNNLAVALDDQGKYAEAEELYRKVLEIKRRVLGEEHPATLDSMNNLGNALWGQGKYAEAEGLHRKTLEIQRRVLGEEHPATLDSMNNLGMGLSRQGKYAEAEALHRKTLEIRGRVLGEEHPRTLRSMNNLGNALRGQGKYAEAEGLDRKTLEIRRRVLGEEHPDTLASMGNLGNALWAQGKYAEAEELYRKTLGIERRVLGEEHRATLDSMNNLGMGLSRQGKYAEAEALHRKTLEIRGRVLGEEHPLTLWSMSSLLEVLNAERKTEEARPLGVELITLRRRRAESDQPGPVDLSAYASILLTCEPEDLRDPRAALMPAERAVEMTGGRNYEMLDTLALAYHRTGKIDEAVMTQRKALGLLPPEQSPTRTEMEGRLGEYLTEQRNFTEAEGLLLKTRESLTRREYVPPEDLKEAVERIVKLYESWDAAEPGKGYDVKAAEYRAKLPKENGE